jgi:hypothetical protein
METVSFAFISSKAGKFGFSVVIALLAVLGGFYSTAYHFPQGASDAERAKARRPAYPPEVQGRTKVEVPKAELEATAEARGETKLEILDAEREMQVASARHKLCLTMAQKNYEATWAANCKTISEQDRKRHERCIAQVDTKAVCAPLGRIPSETCALPVELSSRLNKELEEQKSECRPQLGSTTLQQ